MEIDIKKAIYWALMSRLNGYKYDLKNGFEIEFWTYHIRDILVIIRYKGIRIVSFLMEIDPWRLNYSNQSIDGLFNEEVKIEFDGDYLNVTKKS